MFQCNNKARPVGKGRTWGPVECWELQGDGDEAAACGRSDSSAFREAYSCNTRPATCDNRSRQSPIETCNNKLRVVPYDADELKLVQIERWEEAANCGLVLPSGDSQGNTVIIGTADLEQCLGVMKWLVNRKFWDEDPSKSCHKAPPNNDRLRDEVESLKMELKVVKQERDALKREFCSLSDDVTTTIDSNLSVLALAEYLAKFQTKVHSWVFKDTKINWNRCYYIEHIPDTIEQTYSEGSAAKKAALERWANLQGILRMDKYWEPIKDTASKLKDLRNRYVHPSKIPVAKALLALQSNKGVQELAAVCLDYDAIQNLVLNVGELNQRMRSAASTPGQLRPPLQEWYIGKRFDDGTHSK